MTVVQKNIGKKSIESNNFCFNKQEEGGRVRPQAEGVRGAPGENYCFYSTNFPHNRQINIFFKKIRLQKKDEDDKNDSLKKMEEELARMEKKEAEMQKNIDDRWSCTKWKKSKILLFFKKKWIYLLGRPSWRRRWRRWRRSRRRRTSGRGHSGSSWPASRER